MKNKYLIIAIYTVFFFSSCEEAECDQETYTYVQLNFYEFNNQENGQSKATTVNELTVYGLSKPDSLLYNANNNVRSIVLPLDNNAPQSTFVLKNSIGTDTLTIGYDLRPEYISVECGITMTYTVNDTAFTKNAIRDLRIINPLVNVNSKENIRLFY